MKKSELEKKKGVSNVSEKGAGKEELKGVITEIRGRGLKEKKRTKMMK